MFDQLTDLFQVIFHTYLAAFEKDFDCQTTLLRLAEDWKGNKTTTDMFGPYGWICPRPLTVFHMTSYLTSCQPIAFLRQHVISCKVICQTADGKDRSVSQLVP